MVYDTSRVSSAKICSGVPVARLSSVDSTDPSIEFSIGTQAKSASWDRTAANAAAVLSAGTGVTAADGFSPASGWGYLPRAGECRQLGTMPLAAIRSNAASVKVLSGPR
jgi:hypothetical protein